ncbi:hypothetical protein CDAR_249641 [Caerostris darwini]|uniref:Uncharacterized protein n=1 Tax=Caerostris darwini TaxID=1538125 RepID=A0AAV4RJS4_9ARAC|nr:hypothetical protein CDAR_249641 [Caerostris darwini]
MATLNQASRIHRAVRLLLCPTCTIGHVLFYGILKPRPVCFLLAPDFSFTVKGALDVTQLGETSDSAFLLLVDIFGEPLLVKYRNSRQNLWLMRS